jgi:hypothetical protein
MSALTLEAICQISFRMHNACPDLDYLTCLAQIYPGKDRLTVADFGRAKEEASQVHALKAQLPPLRSSCGVVLGNRPRLFGPDRLPSAKRTLHNIGCV